MDLSPDGTTLAVALTNQNFREIKLIDTASRKVVGTLTPSIGTPWAVRFGRPGRLYSVGFPIFGTAMFDVVHVWDVASRTQVGQSATTTGDAESVAITADGNTLYESETTQQGQRLVRYDITTDTPVAAGATPATTFGEAVAVKPDDSRVYDSNGTVWSGDLQTQLGTLPGPNTSQAVAYAAGGDMVFTAVQPANGTAVTRANGTTLAAMGTRNTVQTTALAVNAAGRIAYVGMLNGLESIDFNAPDAPPNLTARAGIGSVLLTWSPPADPGISPITSYDVICSNCPGVTVPATQTSVVLTGLAATNHVFTVDAVNASGAGPSSIAMGATPEAGGTFHALSPTRILDTRNGTGTGTVAPIGPGATLHLQVAQRGGVPAANVSAVVLNVTVTDTTAASFLTVFPAGTALPTASSLNWVAGETVPNLVEVALGAGGQVSLFNHSGSTDVVVDVEGWVGDATNSSGLSGMFNGLQPARLLDTRTGPGGIVGPLGPGATLNLQVTGAGGVPATGVSAVVLNVTVTDTSDASFLTVFPAGTARPTASNLNWVPGETVPNRVIVEVGAGGQVSVFNHSGSTDVVVDVNGWFTDASSSAGGSGFAAVVPTRILDSRIPGGSGPLQGGATFTLTPTGPSDLTGVVINLTATDATSATFLTAWPAGQPQPRTSDLNPAAGQTVPNMVVVGLGKGSFEVFNQQGSVDVIADLMGQYGAVVQATSPA